jgi:hypothetical protein
MMVPGNAKVALTLRVTSRRAIDILSATSGLSSVGRLTLPAPHSESEGYFDGSTIHVAIYGPPILWVKTALCAGLRPRTLVDREAVSTSSARRIEGG